MNISDEISETMIKQAKGMGMPRRQNSDNEHNQKKKKVKEQYVDELKLLDELCNGVKKLLQDNR